jgi:hypothetical protein
MTQNGSVVRYQLDGQLGDYQDIPGFCKLPDKTWEPVLHRSYVTELRSKLNHHSPGCCLNTAYNPTDPSAAEENRYGSRFIAQRCVHYEFMTRVEEMQRAWPIAAIYYRLPKEEEEGQRCFYDVEKF